MTTIATTKISVDEKARNIIRWVWGGITDAEKAKRKRDIRKQY